MTFRLQRERALTCGFVGSGGLEPFFVQAMEASHQATDDALDAAPDAAFRSKLVGMRNDVEWVVVRVRRTGCMPMRVVRPGVTPHILAR